ncbi:TraR/DksA family transcriptional regulator [Jatrophihabitans sp. YIM 134969]
MTELEALRADLVERIAATEADLRAVAEATAGANTDDEHDPEGATIAWERQQAAASRDRLQARLSAVDAALERVAAGTYGRCVVCGQPIAPERLEARPEVATCVNCAR